MIFSSERRFAAIEKFQKQEIISLASAEPARAEKESLRPHYTQIGKWLPTHENGKPGGRILELGCGPGRYVALLASLGYDVVGVDPYTYTLWDDIRQCRNVEFIDGIKAEKLPFEDASFDHVACISALLYFDDPQKALSEIRRVLRPGGRLYVRTVNSRNLSRRWRAVNIDSAANNYFDEKELTAYLIKGGFEVKKTFTYGFFPPIWTDFWWYLVNGPISISAQERLSALTPPDMRVNVVAYAQLTEDF